MEAQDPLSELADIHLPEAVAFWPPAPGWWVLAALVLLALGLLLRQQLQRLLVRRRLATALRELDAVYATWQHQSQQPEQRNNAGLTLLYGFNTILKRVALYTCRDPDVPRLTGHAWLQFLDSHEPRSDFTTGVGQVLADGTYRPVFDADVEGLHALCRRWISARYLQAEPAAKKVPAASAKEARA